VGTVLLEVALVTGGGDLLDDLGTPGPTQLLELGLELVISILGEPDGLLLSHVRTPALLVRTIAAPLGRSASSGFRQMRERRVGWVPPFVGSTARPCARRRNSKASKETSGNHVRRVSRRTRPPSSRRRYGALSLLSAGAAHWGRRWSFDVQPI